MTYVVNLFGGPGCGKSTLSAELFVRLKRRRVSCELVREYVKDWAWEGRPITGFDQFYVVGKQIRKESILYGKVDLVVTDCPIWNSAFYESHYEGTRHLSELCHAYHSYAAEHEVQHLNFLLRRKKEYDPRGRYQNEEQARAIDVAMEAFLNENKLAYTVCDGDEGGQSGQILDALAERGLI